MGGGYTYEGSWGSLTVRMDLKISETMIYVPLLSMALQVIVMQVYILLLALMPTGLIHGFYMRKVLRGLLRHAGILADYFASPWIISHE
jgi:hypothetical protein